MQLNIKAYLGCSDYTVLEANGDFHNITLDIAILCLCNKNLDKTINYPK